MTSIWRISKSIWNETASRHRLVVVSPRRSAIQSGGTESYLGSSERNVYQSCLLLGIHQNRLEEICAERSLCSVHARIHRRSWFQVAPHFHPAHRANEHLAIPSSRSIRSLID